MPREILPVESQGPLTDYEALIYQQIIERGDENLPQLNRFTGLMPPAREHDVSPSPTGELRFGAVWQPHRIDVEEFQVLYAFKPPTLYESSKRYFIGKPAWGALPGADQPIAHAKAELYIYEFGDKGVIARTQFAEHEGELRKHRVSTFAAAHGFGITELSEAVRPRA